MTVTIKTTGVVNVKDYVEKREMGKKKGKSE